MSADLVAAAQHERDRRAASYPEKIRNGADVETLTVDFQCWVAITEWIETDRFFSFAGGADPDSPNAPIISWPHLEAAADAALTRATAKCDRLFDSGKIAEYEQVCARRSALWEIHRKVKLRRESIDLLNTAFRARRATQELAA